MKLQHEFDDLPSSFDGAILSTFVFNTDYFEETLLRLLSRRSLSGETIVCVDSGSYKETISNEEVTPRNAGKAYYLEPIRISNGRFHPKVYFFASEDRAAAFVGSANLTSAAFDQNQEVITKFEVENEEDGPTGPEIVALGDIHEFYTHLIDHPVAEAIGVTATDKMKQLLETTAWITESEPDKRFEETTAVLHNLDTPLLDQIESRIEDRGEEIEHVDIIAPFYGMSVSVPETLTRSGIHTRIWLQQNHTQVDLDAVQSWEQNHTNAEAVVYDCNRYVHGKVLLIQTDTAAYCLAGSPNASQAAMLETVRTSNGYANIEVGVFRRHPESDHFAYLRDKLAAHRLEAGAEEFTPQIESDYQPPEVAPPETVDLLSVDFTRSEVFEGGRLHGQIRLTSPVNETDELELTIHSVKEMDPVSIQFSGSELTAVEDADSECYTFSRRMTDEQQLTLLSHPAQVSPSWNGTDGDNRWLSIESRDVDREVESAATDDGVDSVWRTVQDIFLGEEELRNDRIEFLGSLANELNEPQQKQVIELEDDPDQTVEDEDNEDDNLTEVINLPNYGGPTSTTDPAKQLEGYFETWTDQVRRLRNLLFNDEANNEEILSLVGERLAAMNRTNTWLAIARQELQAKNKNMDGFPTDLPEKYSNILYTRTEPGFGSENTSVTAQFVTDAYDQLDSKVELELLWKEIGTNVMFGQLIAHRLLIDDADIYEQSIKSDFDRLTEQCFSEYESVVGKPITAEEISEVLWNHYGDLPATLQSASLSRRPPAEFRKKNSAQRYIHRII